MKKKMIFVVAAAAAVATGIMGYSTMKTTQAPSALALANIEALTYDEWGYDHGCLDDGDGCMLITNSQWFPNHLPKDM